MFISAETGYQDQAVLRWVRRWFAVASCGREESQERGKERRESGSGRTLFVFSLAAWAWVWGDWVCGMAVLPNVTRSRTHCMKGERREKCLLVPLLHFSIDQVPFLNQTGVPAHLRSWQRKRFVTPACSQLDRNYWLQPHLGQLIMEMIRPSCTAYLG